MKQNKEIRIAITGDTALLRCRLLVKLIKICGAVPVLIPHTLELGSLGIDTIEDIGRVPHSLIARAQRTHLEHVKALLSTCSGVLIPGNRHDIPPLYYGQEQIHPETEKRLSKNPLYIRAETELLMAKHALKEGWPILGICGGFQIMNVVLGGSLHQNLPDDPRAKQCKIPHRDKTLKTLSQKKQKEWEKTFEGHIKSGEPKNIYPATHSMRVEADSLLGEIYREVYGDINLDAIGELSIHHQGCFKENLANGLKPIAFAPDGVIEAAELTTHNSMCLITQFHFECNVSGIAKTAVQKLVDAAS